MIVILWAWPPDIQLFSIDMIDVVDLGFTN